MSNNTKSDRIMNSTENIINFRTKFFQQFSITKKQKKKVADQNMKMLYFQWLWYCLFYN